MVIYLELGAGLRMAQLMPLPLTVSCFSKIQIGIAFLVPAHPGSPGKRAIKRVCVCVLLYNLFLQLCSSWQDSHRQSAAINTSYGQSVVAEFLVCIPHDYQQLDPQCGQLNWRCWLGGRKCIWPVKNWVVGCWHGYLSGARCRLAYGPADATATHYLLVLPFWYWLNRVVPEKGPLNGCVCVYV